jgi:predicted PurR-regulated permease PerM
MTEAQNPADMRVVKVAAWMVILSVVVFCLVYFSNFLQPIVVAGMIWYAVYELKSALGKMQYKKKTLPNWLRTSLAFLIILLVIMGIYEIVVTNLQLIMGRSNHYLANFRNMLEGLQALEGFGMLKNRLEDMATGFNIQPLLSSLLNSITSLAGNLFLIIIYVAFLLVEERFFSRKLSVWIADQSRREKIIQVIDEVAAATRKYIVVKTQMSVLTGVLSYVVLQVFQVDFALWWAFLIFLLNYIPYIGSFFATLFPAVFASFQYQSFWMLLWIFLAIQGIQFMVGNVLEPKVMGRTLNLSPLGVLIALTFWGVIWGILGMLLSVPITSIMVIVSARFESTRFLAIWFSETGEIGLQDGGIK